MTARRTDRAPSAADHKPAPRPAAPAAPEPEGPVVPAEGPVRLVVLPPAKGTRKPKATRPCACGCGSQTKATFAPGHDMRVGPRAEGKVAGEKAARAALASGKLEPPALPENEAARALFLAGFANGIRLGLVV